MHSYSTDSGERETILLLLAAFAIAAAWGESRLLQLTRLAVPFWLDAPSTMAFYGIFFKVFDIWLWRVRFLHRMGLLKVPILSGGWKGFVVSSFDNHKKAHPVAVFIDQTWTKMSVRLQSDNSHSFTSTASLQVHAPEGTVLSYQYENQPQPEALRTMEIHVGTARLILQADGLALEGYYYSGRGRKEFGSLKLEKASTNSRGPATSPRSGG
jgi:SMODS-associating 2TM, beta-strand rich effector domain